MDQLIQYSIVALKVWAIGWVIVSSLLILIVMTQKSKVNKEPPPGAMNQILVLGMIWPVTMYWGVLLLIGKKP